ncbi:MAG: NmrA family NAD(P)-binding protein [Candidatus Sericytochromatia bacterium]|nr:NmrA family NAD(P)-binding protein [Candidatus Sericytochromatia bacterium]
MYSVTIQMRCVDAEGRAVVRPASREVVAISRAEAGCLFFDVLFDETDPLLVRFYAAYRDRAAFDAHLGAPHTQHWVRTCMPHVDRASIRLPESVSEWGTEMDRIVVVFGATGKIGTEMVKLLAADTRCKEVRAITRDPAGAQARILEAMGPTVRVLPFVEEQHAAACAGATDAFVVSPLIDDMVGWHATVANALVAAGIGHVVKVSVTGARAPESDPPPGRFPSLHWAGEEALRHSGLKTTVIRPTIFMQHFEMDTGLYERGADAFYLPTGTSGIAFLDCRDIAALGQELLLSPAALPFHGGAYELTGPEAVSGEQIARTLSAVRRGTVRHVDGLEAFEVHCAEIGKADWAKHVYREAADGWFAEVRTETFETLTGRRPRSFAAYAHDRGQVFARRT